MTEARRVAAARRPPDGNSLKGISLGKKPHALANFECERPNDQFEKRPGA
jgi:hypothetical protein